MIIQEFFDQQTYTLSYVVYNRMAGDAVVIDPVLDYDPAASQTSTRSVSAIESYLVSRELKLHYVLETHAHADHLSASQYLRRRFAAKVAIGARITEVQETFAPIFGMDLVPDGRQFDLLLRQGDIVTAGGLRIEVLETPGHTPACVSYLIGDAVFTGDALFIEDYGTGRCDFPRGSAEDLYLSISEKLYALPDTTRVFVGHDYLPGGRPLRCQTTVGTQKAQNVHLREHTDQATFVLFRKTRDATLSAPKLLFPSVQVNINGGRLPAPAGGSALRRLSIPLNYFSPTEEDGTPS